MSAIDDELLLSAADDAAEVEYIRRQLPQELQEKLSDEQLYYVLDVVNDYYATSGVLDAEPDEEGFIDIDLEAVVEHVLHTAKKEQIEGLDADSVLLIVQAEGDYVDSLAEEDE